MVQTIVEAKPTRPITAPEAFAILDVHDVIETFVREMRRTLGGRIGDATPADLRKKTEALLDAAMGILAEEMFRTNAARGVVMKLGESPKREERGIL
jgi:hypothetical protein